MITNKIITDYGTCIYHPLEYPSSESSNVEVVDSERKNILNNWPNGTIMKESFFQHPSVFINVDLSSVLPRIEIINETYQKEPEKEDKFRDLLEYNLVFRIPPQKSYKINMNIKSIKKGVIKFVEP